MSTIPRLSHSHLREAQRIAVRILEPRDPATPRRVPDPKLVLLHKASVPFKLHAGLAESPHGGGDVRDLPAEHREIERREFPYFSHA